MHPRRSRWLRFALLAGAAVAMWALAAANGYGWQLLWLPAVIAGAAWPAHRQRLAHCLRRLRCQRKHGLRSTVLDLHRFSRVLETNRLLDRYLGHYRATSSGRLDLQINRLCRLGDTRPLPRPIRRRRPPRTFLDPPLR